MSSATHLLHTIALVAHIGAGGTGLLLAGPVLFAPKRRGRHTLLGRAYAIATAVLCLSAFVLAAYDPAGLWPFIGIGIGTAACAGGGVWMARNRPFPNWSIWHFNLMGSSVIAFVTAFAMQMADNALWSIVAPTIIGTPLIAYRTRLALTAGRSRLAGT